ncbi:MAG: TIGR01244 family sulfur transferase [Roseovarius sp.]
MDLRQITEEFSVSPQIDPEEMPEIAGAGYASILCNRPDGEEYGQPDFDGIRTAAETAGLEARWVPIVSGQITPDALEAFGAALEEMPKPILAYCRSGTRCTMLWAITQHGRMEEAEIVRRAADAGYDVAGLMRQMQGR